MRMGWQISSGEVDAFLAERPMTCTCGDRPATFVVAASTGWGGHMIDQCAWCLLLGTGNVGDLAWTWSPEHGWATPAVQAGARFRDEVRAVVLIDSPNRELPDEESTVHAWDEIVADPEAPDVRDLHAWALWVLTPQLTPAVARTLVEQDWDDSSSWYTRDVHRWITHGVPRNRVRRARRAASTG
jgi:hypothetical protein